MIKDMLPRQVVGRAEAAGLQNWLTGLDVIVAELEQMWKICTGEVLSGGSHALVALAEGQDGAQYVLKVEMPDSDEADFLRAVLSLAAADGRGYGGMFAYDVPRRAVLLERLGRTMRTADLPARRQMEIICAALCETWTMPAEGIGLPDGADTIAWFRKFIPESWESLGQPCPKKVIDAAMHCLALREAAMRPENWVLLHGDAHNNNALEVPGEPGRFKLVDAEGVFYEREYDLGVLMREWPEDYDEEPLNAGRERSIFLGSLTGADEEGIWQWGFLQTVSTSLVLLQIGDRELGKRMLRTALAWCEGI